MQLFCLVCSGYILFAFYCVLMLQTGIKNVDKKVAVFCALGARNQAMVFVASILNAEKVVMAKVGSASALHSGKNITGKIWSKYLIFIHFRV